jgi:hypothetical protein
MPAASLVTPGLDPQPAAASNHTNNHARPALPAVLHVTRMREGYHPRTAAIE